MESNSNTASAVMIIELGNTSDRGAIPRYKNVKEEIAELMGYVQLIRGKWKLPILYCLTCGTKHFNEIFYCVEGISRKMLSKELKQLEASRLVKRNFNLHYPSPVIEYSVTGKGKLLNKLMQEFYNWGRIYQKRMVRRKRMQRSVSTKESASVRRNYVKD